MVGPWKNVSYSLTVRKSQDTTAHWLDNYINLSDCTTKTRYKVATQRIGKNKMATQTPEKNEIKKIENGS